jgi:hypothetical protein
MWGFGTRGYVGRRYRGEPLLAGFGALITLSGVYKLLAWPGLVGEQEALVIAALAALAVGITLSREAPDPTRRVSGESSGGVAEPMPADAEAALLAHTRDLRARCVRAVRDHDWSSVAALLSDGARDTVHRAWRDRPADTVWRELAANVVGWELRGPEVAAMVRLELSSAGAGREWVDTETWELVATEGSWRAIAVSVDRRASS